MQTWAKRGLQSALVTGGLLMLGTGIASADETASPDNPAGPLDVDVTVPIDVADNAVGTPSGQYDAPEYHNEISTDAITDPVENGLTGSPADEHSRGNKADLDVTAPIQVTGNALGVAGDAQTESHRAQSYHHDDDTVTDGAGQALAGNAVVLDWAAPVQLSGNSAGVLGGSAETSGTAAQDVAETGDVSTDGSDGVLSGNAGAAQFATPVQVTGNAVGGLLGQADSDFAASTEAVSGGFLRTDGDGGVLSGNAGGGPLALPLKGNGNAASPLGGDSTAQSTSSADATAGGTQPGLKGFDTYIETSGNDSTGSGNIVTPQGAGVGNLAGNAASVLGNAATGNAVSDGARAATGGSSSSEMDSGGFVYTYGDHAAGSGNVVSAPIAGAGEVFGSAAAAVGNSDAQHHSNTDAMAGDGTFSTGNHSVLSGNTASAPLGLAPEVFGVAGSLAGNSSAEAAEHKLLDAGGYNGTQGNESTGSGNLIQTPVGAAPELFGAGATALGQADGNATEHKVIKPGGPGNTEDDGATLSSNLIGVPAALPVQGFGIAGALLGNADGNGDAETDIDSGGWYHATGVGGSGSGNIVQAPVALPGQAHGIGLAGGGIAEGVSNNDTEASAGGDASSDGTGGSIAGNIVQAPVGGALSAFGLGGAVGGDAVGIGGNDVVVDSGGDSTTAGDFGALAGNVVGPQVMPIVQGFGDAASLGGSALGIGNNVTDVTTGGDITTSGEQGALSGDILDVPVGAVAQAFGVAGTIGGNATGVGLNETTGEVGGVTETAGDHQRGSGIDTQLPVGVVAQLYEVSGELLGTATTVATNDTDVLVGNEEPLNLDFTDRHLSANELPTLPRMSSFGSRSAAQPAGAVPTTEVPGAGVFSGELPGDGIADSAPAVNVPPKVTTMDGLPTKALPNMSDAAGRSAGQLPTQGNLAGRLPVQLPSLDGVDVAPQAELPAMAQLDSAVLPALAGASQSLSGTPLNIG